MLHIAAHADIRTHASTFVASTQAMIPFLLLKGADPDIRREASTWKGWWHNYGGQTPLMGANSQPAIVDLLASNATLEVVDDQKRNVFMWHSKKAKPETEMLLYSRSSTKQNWKNSTDRNGRTIASYAAQGGRNTILDRQVKRKYDIHRADNQGLTPAMYAAIGNHTNLIGFFHVEQFNIQDKKGYSPLMHAAANGNEDFVRALCLAPGVDKELTTPKRWYSKGKTAADLARKNDHADIALIIETEPDVEAIG